MSDLTRSLASTTFVDTARRLSLIEQGLVLNVHWCLVDVAMRLGWLAAKGTPPSLLNPLVERFRALEESA